MMITALAEAAATFDEPRYRDAAERAAGGASPDADDPAAPRWWSGALAQPVCQLGFGDRKTAGDGFSRDTDLSGDPPSRLGRAAVVEALEPVLAV